MPSQPPLHRCCFLTGHYDCRIFISRHWAPHDHACNLLSVRHGLYTPQAGLRKSKSSRPRSYWVQSITAAIRHLEDVCCDITTLDTRSFRMWLFGIAWRCFGTMVSCTSLEQATLCDFGRRRRRQAECRMLRCWYTQ